MSALAPPWPTPLMPQEDFAAFRGKWHKEIDDLALIASDKLEVMLQSLDGLHPGYRIDAVLFDHGSQVGVTVAGPTGARAARVPVQGFDQRELERLVEMLK